MKGILATVIFILLIALIAVAVTSGFASALQALLLSLVIAFVMVPATVFVSNVFIGLLFGRRR